MKFVTDKLIKQKMSNNSTFIPGNGNGNLPSIFDLRNLVPAQVERLIPLMTPAFQRPVLSVLTNKLKGGVKTKAGSRVVYINRQPNDYPYATIKNGGRTASGSLLILDFTDPEFEALVKGEYVNSITGCIAEVVEKQPGKVTLAFRSNPNGNTAFVTADFAAGEIVSAVGVVGNILDRTNPEGVFTLPIQYKQIIGRWEAGTVLTEEDVNQTTYVQASNGQMAYALNKEVQELQKMYQKYYKYMLMDFPAIESASKPMGASIVNQIKNQGGLSVPLTGTMNRTKLQDAVDQYIAHGGSTGKDVLITGGYAYITGIQSSLESFVTTSGTTNVIGGQEVKGLNIPFYAYGGLTLKLMYDPFMENPQMWGVDSDTGRSARSNSAIWMNEQETVDTENGGKMPFIVDYYHSKTPDVHRWVVPGSMDDKGNLVTTGSSEKTAASINFKLDRTTVLTTPSGCLVHGI